MKEFSKINDLELIENCDLSKFHTMKLKSMGCLAIVKTEKALQDFIKLAQIKKVEFVPIGLGANILLKQTQNKILLKLELPFDKSELEILKDEYTFPASINLSKITSLAIKFGLKGYEAITGIPASLGGAIYMNAGTRLGEIGPLIKAVKVVTKNGEVKEYQLTSNDFTYRKNLFLKEGEIIFEVTMKNMGTDPLIAQIIKDYMRYRKKSQPLTVPNCGCVFKNTSTKLGAGMLIDRLGLKGLTVKNLKLSHKHSNFIENHGQSDYEDFEEIVKMITSEVYLTYGIKLEREAIVLG